MSRVLFRLKLDPLGCPGSSLRSTKLKLKNNLIESQADQHRSTVPFSKEPITLVMACSALSPTQSRPEGKHSTGMSHSAPLTRARHHYDAGPATCLCLGFVPRLTPGESRWADSRHATPIRACISPDLRSLSAFSAAFGKCAHWRKASWLLESSQVRPRRICLVKSSALRAMPISLPSFLQRKARQNIHIIIIDTCSLRLGTPHFRPAHSMASYPSSIL
jgi:hypothetical protein